MLGWTIKHPNGRRSMIGRDVAYAYSRFDTHPFRSFFFPLSLSLSSSKRSFLALMESHAFHPFASVIFGMIFFPSLIRGEGNIDSRVNIVLTIAIDTLTKEAIDPSGKNNNLFRLKEEARNCRTGCWTGWLTFQVTPFLSSMIFLGRGRFEGDGEAGRSFCNYFSILRW